MSKKKITRLKQLFAAVLLVTLAFTLAACSQSPESSKNSSADVLVSAEDTASQQFVFLGDTQQNPDTGEILVRKLLSETPPSQAILLAGDLVNDPGDKEEWNAFYAEINSATKEDRVIAAVGNHTPDDLVLPKTAQESDLSGFAIVDYGRTRFVVANSNLMGTTDDVQVTAITAFLKNAIEESPAATTIVLMHHPLYPVGPDPKNAQRAQTMQDNYGQILHSSDLILCGHEHVYARVEVDGLTQISGVATSKLYSEAEHPYIKTSLAKPVATFLTVTSDGIQLKTYDLEQNLVDEAQLTHR